MTQVENTWVIFVYWRGGSVPAGSHLTGDTLDRKCTIVLPIVTGYSAVLSLPNLSMPGIGWAIQESFSKCTFKWG